jgi:hypothetical protein
MPVLALESPVNDAKTTPFRSTSESRSANLSHELDRHRGLASGTHNAQVSNKYPTALLGLQQQQISRSIVFVES